MIDHRLNKGYVYGNYSNSDNVYIKTSEAD